MGKEERAAPAAAAETAAATAATSTATAVAKPGLLRKIKFYVKFTLGISVFLILLFLVVVPITVVRRLLGIQRGLPADLLWIPGEASLPFIGVKYKLEGRVDLIRSGHQPYIFVLNHQSQLDSMVMATNVPTDMVIVAKRSLLLMPGIGFILWLTDAILIDRKNHASSVASMAAAAQRVTNDKLSVAVFPEGTRNRHGGLLPFKKGAFHLARQANVPVVPIVLSEYTDPTTGIYNSDVFLFSSGTITIRVLDPIRPHTEPTVERLRDRTRAAMSAALVDMNRSSGTAHKAKKAQ
ncbi:hypothetical protein PTSG_11296 [Salpingoeca rosetta]|uniref:1-acyl-sn-glycerol-3-phosphate acyltransferase n=1 Tax=Salpingoeca rosetta (strain ATCC 50818 / BSB-021) TaxID=946362 RepID=F2UT01_SALR5|nr:uncharacterized protein PTSG_11296 [Salpingoeca rosetta]EGD81260.1 hypothetical protein PTSG_11296 [Salpingoeca rosetta]|eukprot:XP_004987656.1 hypothetical protein PTSG_11296 [Salpingoeca rosetta]